MGCGSSSSNTCGSKDYKALNLLGSGFSCQVYRCRHLPTKVEYAWKKMTNKSGDMMGMFDSEVNILKLLNHDNVLQYRDSWIDDNLNLITTLCEGGELFDRIADNGPFSELWACKLARDMFSALAFCHKKGVVHRDLKPENFVFEDCSARAKIRLLDFGCALQVKDSELVNGVCGSLYYFAPETISKQFNGQRTGKIWKSSDVWAMGVITFILLCGYPPFQGGTEQQTFSKIKSGKYEYPKKSENIVISDIAKDLIGKCLTMDPTKRISAEEALQLGSKGRVSQMPNSLQSWLPRC